MQKEKRSYSGMGLPGVLTTIFVVLKLVGVIDWSWWLVLSPMLVTLGLFLVLVLIIVIGTILDD